MMSQVRSVIFQIAKAIEQRILGPNGMVDRTMFGFVILENFDAPPLTQNINP